MDPITELIDMVNGFLSEADRFDYCSFNRGGIKVVDYHPNLDVVRHGALLLRLKGRYSGLYATIGNGSYYILPLEGSSEEAELLMALNQQVAELRGRFQRQDASDILQVSRAMKILDLNSLNDVIKRVWNRIDTGARHHIIRYIGVCSEWQWQSDFWKYKSGEDMRGIAHLASKAVETLEKLESFDFQQCHPVLRKEFNISHYKQVHERYIESARVIKDRGSCFA